MTTIQKRLIKLLKNIKNSDDELIYCVDKLLINDKERKIMIKLIDDGIAKDCSDVSGYAFLIDNNKRPQD